MIRHFDLQKGIALVAAVVAIACVTMLFSTGLINADSTASAALGPDWQCNRIAFVFTSCNRVPGTTVRSAQIPKQQACTRPRI
jgi:hypothetical protein